MIAPHIAITTIDLRLVVALLQDEDAGTTIKQHAREQECGQSRLHRRRFGIR